MKLPFAPRPLEGLVRPAGFLFLLLIPLVTLVPYDPVPVWLTQDLVLRLGSALVFLLLALGPILKAKEPLSVSLDLSSLVLLALAGWVLLSTRNSLQSFDSFYGLKSFVALLLWWFSLRRLWEKHPFFFAAFEKVFFWTACVVSVWIIVTTLAHKFGMKVILDNGIIPRKGPFTNPNVAGGFLGMFLVWKFLKMLHKEKVSWVGFGLGFLAWGMTESRGALVAMIVTVVFYLVLHMREVEAKLRRWTRREWILFGVVLLVLLIPLSFMLNRLFHFLGNLDDDPRRFFRLDIWLVSLQMIKAQPLFGFGPGTFGDVFSNFRPGTFWNVGTPFAHNEYLQVAAECGLPAVLLTLLFLGLLFRGTFGAAKSTKAFSGATGTTSAGEVAFFLILLESVHCLVDFTFHEWSHRLILLAFMTRAAQGHHEEKDLSATLRFSRPFYLVSGAFLTFFVLWVLGVGGFRDYCSKLNGYKAVLEMGKSNQVRAEFFAKKSVLIRENFSTAWDTLGFLEKIAGEMDPSPAKKEKHFRQADEYFRKAISLAPYTQSFLEHQVQAMFSRGRLEQALDLQLNLVERSPQLPNHMKNLALILMKLGRHQGALAAAQRSIELDHFYIPGYSLKGQALMAMGHLREALATFEEEKALLERMGRGDPSGQIDMNIQQLKAKLGIKN